MTVKTIKTVRSRRLPVRLQVKRRMKGSRENASSLPSWLSSYWYVSTSWASSSLLSDMRNILANSVPYKQLIKTSFVPCWKHHTCRNRQTAPYKEIGPVWSSRSYWRDVSYLLYKRHAAFYNYSFSYAGLPNHRQIQSMCEDSTDPVLFSSFRNFSTALPVLSTTSRITIIS